ncbi:hypothetical protein [Szabonella alba]|uniref:Uncharacterized protein n=1 Tax=Szabonella alba TaxID=2804194 RepID=A0A8K0V8A7_9RHOB|nr:hypothetical protein [Szabonella alba]MBL4916116.1 hypothetical protein [Szabonella alba]
MKPQRRWMKSVIATAAQTPTTQPFARQQRPGRSSAAQNDTARPAVIRARHPGVGRKIG